MPAPCDNRADAGVRSSRRRPDSCPIVRHRNFRRRPGWSWFAAAARRPPNLRHQNLRHQNLRRSCRSTLDAPRSAGSSFVVYLHRASHRGHSRERRQGLPCRPDRRLPCRPDRRLPCRLSVAGRGSGRVRSGSSRRVREPVDPPTAPVRLREPSSGPQAARAAAHLGHRRRRGKERWAACGPRAGPRSPRTATRPCRSCHRAR